MKEEKVSSLRQWLQTPAGQYVLQWEQAHLDVAVANLFGFHALQLGMPELDTLRANRMPHRWVVADAPGEAETQPITSAAAAVTLSCDFDALPFGNASLDLVVLPHSLELARDPHLALREVERVLVPEGRIVIVGFNPSSLWGVRQQLGRLWGSPPDLFMPGNQELMRYGRLRDWLRLLSFEVENGRFGCYRPPLNSSTWLTRFAWADRLGEHWWPVLGAVYFVVAVKRVRGMRLVGLAKNQRCARNPVPVGATHQQEHQP
jgi:SAM-dependent methyltransferase